MGQFPVKRFLRTPEAGRSRTTRPRARKAPHLRHRPLLSEAWRQSRLKQYEGRERNTAIPGGKPDTDMPDEAVRRVGRRACPDGPEERDISDTFKLTTRHPARSRPATPERRA